MTDRVSSKLVSVPPEILKPLYQDNFSFSRLYYLIYSREMKETTTKTKT
jgi:hypothetical protein